MYKKTGARLMTFFFLTMSFYLSGQLPYYEFEVDGNSKMAGKLFIYDEVQSSTATTSVFVGLNAGSDDDGGNSNVFVGFAAGEDNVSGTTSVFVGNRAGKNNIDGYGNAFLGYFAGNQNSSGFYNTYLGEGAGRYVVDGAYNTFVGTRSGTNSSQDEINTSIAIGYNAKVTCDNCAVIGGTGNQAVKVGIGTDTPTADLHIYSNSLLNSPQIQLAEEDEGDYARINFSNQTLDDYWAIAGRGNGTTTAPRLNFYYNSGTGGTDIMTIEGESASVGIGDNSPDCKLDVSGDICSNDMMLTSDARYKRNIHRIEDPINKLTKISGFSYQFNTIEFQEKNFAEGKRLGLIAQNVEAVFPELVKTFDDGYKAVRYNGLIPVLIESIKAQQEEIKRQATEYDELVNQIENQQKEIEQLKMLVHSLLPSDPVN